MKQKESYSSLSVTPARCLLRNLLCDMFFVSEIKTSEDGVEATSERSKEPYSQWPTTATTYGSPLQQSGVGTVITDSAGRCTNVSNDMHA